MRTARKISAADLPDGWRMVRLGEFTTIGAGKTPTYSNDDGAVPVIGSNGRIGLTDKSNFSNGVAVGRVGASGSVHRISEPVWLSDNVLFVQPDAEKWDVSYLYNALQLARLPDLASKTAQPLLTQTNLTGINLLLPPLPEQRAIADVLDSIDEAIERTEAVIAATETLRDSLLHELLTRGVPGWHTEWKEVPGIGTIPADWEVVRLGEVIPKFDYGTSVQCFSEPIGTPVLRIPNIASGDLNLSDLKYGDLSSSELAKLRLGTGDILLVRTNGNPDICGRSWVTQKLQGDWAFASYLVRGRPDPSRVEPAFVGHFLKSDAGRRLLRGHIRTSAGNYNLSVGELGSIPFPCPPLSEQERIIDSVSSNADLIEGLRIELGRLNLAKNATSHVLLSGHV